MNAILLYCILMIALLIYSFVRKKHVLGKILVSCYAFIAVVSVFVPTKGILQYAVRLNYSLVDYKIIIFMVVAFVIFFSPFLYSKTKFNVKNFDYKINSNYVAFEIIFIVLGLFTVFIYSNDVFSLVKGGNWASNRLAMSSDAAIYPYNNVIEKLVIIFTNYFHLLGLIVGFMMLISKKHRNLGILGILISCLCEFCWDSYVSSRGMIAQFLLLILALYFFFYSGIGKRSRKYINLICLASGVTIMSYLTSVTISRFSGSSLSSLIYYFGQIPYFFGMEVQRLKEPMMGRFAFGVLFGDEKFPDYMGIWIRGFYTFLGWLYADWGFTGVIIIGVMCAIFFGKLINKKRFYVCDVYIIFAYYKLMLQGAFTVGRTKIYSIIITILIYLFLRFVIDRYIFVIGKNKKKLEGDN